MNPQIKLYMVQRQCTVRWLAQNKVFDSLVDEGGDLVVLNRTTGMGFSIVVAAIIYQVVLYSSLNLLHVIYMSIDCDIPYVIQW